MDALVVPDGEVDPDQLESVEFMETMASAVIQGRFGPAGEGLAAEGQPTEPRQGAEALISIVGALVDGGINVAKVRSIKAVSVNRRAPIAVADIVSDVEQLMDRQNARAVRAIFGRAGPA